MGINNYSANPEPNSAASEGRRILGRAASAVAGAALLLAVAAPLRAAVVEPNAESLLKNKKVLVLDGQSGSHAGARTNATASLNAMAKKVGFAMTMGDSRLVTLDYLNKYDIVVFNYFFETQKMTQASQDAFKAWFAEGGKGYVGYHNSGANEAGEWDWYRNNVTSSLYNIHALGAQNGTLIRTKDAAILSQPIMLGLDSTFTGSDEWYDFGFGATWADCKVMYYLDEANLANHLPRPMNPHPAAWFREDPVTKSRFFYAIYIHSDAGAATDFFASNILRALEYTAGYQPASPITSRGESIRTWKDMSFVTDSRELRVSLLGSYNLSVYSAAGKKLFSVTGQGDRAYRPEAIRKPGLYIVKLQAKAANLTQRIMVY